MQCDYENYTTFMHVHNNSTFFHRRKESYETYEIKKVIKDMKYMKEKDT